jgi:hypothetical protein
MFDSESESSGDLGHSDSDAEFVDNTLKDKEVVARSYLHNDELGPVKHICAMGPSFSDAGRHCKFLLA